MYINQTKKNYGVKCKLCKGSIQYMEKYWVDIKYSNAILDLQSDFKDKYHGSCWTNNEDWWISFKALWWEIGDRVANALNVWKGFCDIWAQIGTELNKSQYSGVSWAISTISTTGNPLLFGTISAPMFVGDYAVEDITYSKPTKKLEKSAPKTVSVKESYKQLADFMGMIYQILFSKLSDADARSRLLDLD